MFQLSTRSLILWILTVFGINGMVFAQNPGPASSPTGSGPGYRWKDTYLSRVISPQPQQSPFFLPKVGPISTLYFHSPTQQFFLDEKWAPQLEQKIPQALNFNEYASLQSVAVRKQLLREYENMSDGTSSTSGRGLRPKLSKNPVFDRLFGGKIPEFRPKGFVSVDLKVGNQFVDNPLIPLFNRRTRIFDFDQQINIDFNSLFDGLQVPGLGGRPGGSNPLGALGNTLPNLPGAGANPLDDFGANRSFPNPSNLAGALGSLDPSNALREKMGITGNFNTKSAFSYENRFKLNFKNDPEDILQVLELGNVSMPMRSQLIPGVENLMGVKAGLRFGKLDVTTVFAQQRSRTESILINGGNQSKPFELRVDNYDENRHFFLGHFFRENYERSLRNLPKVISGVRITRVEVYVTNRTNTVNSMRNLVGITDLGEAKPANPSSVISTNPNGPAGNQANNLYDQLVENSDFRTIDNTSRFLNSLNLRNGEDFEILRGAKRLTDREFEIQPELGYISLLTPLRNDEILAVAYEYTFNGRAYKVGELTEDYSFRKEDEVLMLKLLKSSTIRNRLNHPMWDLMMKNIYTLSQGQVTPEGFQLRILYKDDATGIDNPNLQEGRRMKDRPLVEALGLDRLNFNQDPQPDGNFDYVPGITIQEKLGKVIFPVLEPFGSHLARQFDSDEEILREKYVFNELYRGTMIDAQQVTTKNKFFLSGQIRSGSTEIPLPLGASPQSVRVYAGGVQLQQGTDYQVDTQLGRIRITNPSLINSSRQIRIDYERPDLFEAQIRRMFGLRLDYVVSPFLRLGATLMDLRENTPGFITRTAVGMEPVNNTLWGVDVNYLRTSFFLTNLLNKIPTVQSEEKSRIRFNAEFAQLLPGVNNRRVNNNAMLDDFEAVRQINDLTRQPTRWRLGSTPENFQETGQSIYGYHFRRAKMSAYTLDPTLFFSAGIFSGGLTGLPEGLTSDGNAYERGFEVQAIFPGRSRPPLGQQPPIATLDLSYFPSERGMYNYNPNLTSDGFLPNPRQNFGSVMRGITFDPDFDNTNVEYLEFWLLDPFADVVRDGTPNGNRRNTTGGKLLFQLGDVSEDVIPDNRFSFENGLLPFESTTSEPVNTLWGKAPRVQYINDAFDSAPDARARQDIGLDGLPNAEERTFPHIQNYLNALRQRISAQAFQKIEQDPSGDDFTFFLDPIYDQTNARLVERFKNYLGMENNSPLTNDNVTVTPANSPASDKEDINGDNTINDIEAYYEYEIPLQPGQLDVGRGFIVDRVTSDGLNWYLYRVPIRQFTNKFGNISGFKSIRFIRTVMTDWAQPVVLRFATLQLVANQYRTYTQDLNQVGLAEIPEPYDAKLRVATVNIEENGCTEAGDCAVKEGQTPYVVPPGFVRDRDFSQLGQIQFNEQSLSIGVTNLRDGDARGVFKNTRLDLNMYKRLQMYLHMENEFNEDGQVAAFLRLGTDLKENYYEIEIPRLKATPNGSIDPGLIWPIENEIDIPLDELRMLKVTRNRQGIPLNVPFSDEIKVGGFAYENNSQSRTLDVEREYKITVVGNPDLSTILTLMIGVRNPKSEDQQPKSFTIWANEMRINGFDQTPGEAGLINADIQLADIGSIQVNGQMSTFGFGGVQSKIAQRSRDYTYGLGVATNLALDRFTPQKWNLSIPFYMSFDQSVIRPHFNPLDPDITLERALASIEDATQRERYRSLVTDQQISRGFNFANVRKNRGPNQTRQRVYDIENFSFTYAQNQVQRSNILIDDYLSEQNRGGLTYQFQPKAINWEPFKKRMSERNDRLWLKDFNFSPLPTLVGFRADYDRSFMRTLFRNSDLNSTGVQPNVQKYFNTQRVYDLQWKLTQSIQVSYNARLTAIIDEPIGDLDTQAKQDSLWRSFWTFGRAKNYEQTLQSTYRLPLDKFFLLDWVQADARFNTRFGYRAASFGISDSLDVFFGNTIENNRERAIQGRIDLVKLYNKVRYLRFANTPAPPRIRYTRAPGDDENFEKETNTLLKSVTRLLMTVRGINFNYSLREATILPGFLPNPTFMGMDRNWQNAPGLPFVFGSQARDIHVRAAQNGWLSTSTVQNDPFTQSIEKTFEYNTNLEPFKGFRMTIRGNLARGDSYQELYRPTETGGAFESLNPFRNGTFRMSFWSFRTGFTRMSKSPEDNYNYEIFNRMQNYRTVVRDRLLAANPGAEAGTYDINSQDVLIGAFFAAYSGKDPNEVRLNPFLRFPLPNWRVDFGGVEKILKVDRVFSSITLNHSYTSTYNVGNFTSSLEYGAQYLNLLVRGYPLGFLTNTQSLFIPIFVMSTITMEEKYAPFIGLQFATKKNITGRIEYNKERRAGLNLSNSQVAEFNSNDFVMGIGFRRNNIRIPFRGRDGNQIVLKNDLNFRFDFTIRDIIALQRRLDGDAVVTQGNYNFQLRPQIEYQFNKRFSGTFYIERLVNNPYNSLSFYRSSTLGGINVRFNLSD